MFPLRRSLGGQAVVRLLSLVVLLSVMSGCASNSISNIRQLEDEQTIMVVSGLGDSLNLRKVGITVLSNSEREVRLPEWNIDQFVEVATSKLIESSRFSSTRRESTDASPIFGEDLWSGNVDFRGAENDIQTAALESGADLILVIYETKRGDPFFQTNQVVHGYGYYEKAYIGSAKTIAYVYFAMSLYEAKTMKRLAGRAAWQSMSVPRKVESITVSEIEENRDTFTQLIKTNIHKLLGMLSII